MCDCDPRIGKKNPGGSLVSLPSKDRELLVQWKILSQGNKAESKRGKQQALCTCTPIHICAHMFTATTHTHAHTVVNILKQLYPISNLYPFDISNLPPGKKYYLVAFFLSLVLEDQIRMSCVQSHWDTNPSPYQFLFRLQDTLFT